MRFLEIVSGVRVPISGEEQQVLLKAEEHGSVAKGDLNDREKEVARNMVSRGLLRRYRHQDQTRFRPNADPTLRRI